METPNSISEETLFSAALQHAPEERAAYLDQACAGNPALRSRVEALLNAQPQLGSFMEVPIERIGRPSQDALRFALAPEERPGTRIDRYKLLQKLGEGGCGVVYMAEQEEPVRRRVALKVIKLGMDTKSVIARFEAERQALAMMDHPNIAKVLDGGATETGRPYFVMELVRGTKITEFCDQHRLSMRERLNLFIQICQAVQHAHQKGIIHRDLKPSNILATIHSPGVPAVPVIIDFGIAKATQGRLTDQTLFTAFEQFLGTPAYMSPEQTLMTIQDVDTRSDIYSLGVLLYELLTGYTPFEGKELLAAGLEEMRRTIREKEPVRPSTRLSTLLAAEQATAALFRQTGPPKLVHLIRGDLDWIVMKCLEKDRARRYETANALAMDLQRHLRNEPVTARPPSRLYEFQKTIRRHKVGFGAAAAVMIVLAAGVLVSSLAAVRARRAELETRRTGYVAAMDLANRALDEGDLGIAREYLRRYLPGSGETDLRNWEWRYLTKLSEGDPHVSLVAHSSWVRLLFLNDGTLLSSGTADWRTVLWSLRERRPSIIITNQNFWGGVSEAMAVAPKRNAMFYRVGRADSPAVRVVDLQSGTEEDLLDAKGFPVDAKAPIVWLDVSPDEKLLAVASTNQVGLWDLDRKTWLEPFVTESGDATQGLFSPDGHVLVVADKSGQVAFWNLAERKRLGVLTNAAESLGVLKFSADGRWLVNPGYKSPTRIWKVEDRTLVAELQDSTPVAGAAFSPDGRWLATVGGDPSVRLWETSGWRKIHDFRGHTDWITAVDFSPNSHFLATGARNGQVKLWSVDPLPTTPGRVSFPPSRYFQLAEDGSGFGRIARASPQTVEVWTSTPLQRSTTVSLWAQPRKGVVLPGGQGLVLGNVDGSLRVVGPVFGSDMVLTNAHQRAVYVIDASLDGSTLATKGVDEEQVRIWRLPHLEPIAGLTNARHVHDVKLSDHGKLLAGFTGAGDMGVWKIPSMKGPPMWPGVPALGHLTACAFSPDNRRLAAAHSDGGAFLWDLATHRRVALPRALNQYTSLSFSADGSRLAAGSEGESKLFDTATGRVILSFKQHGLKVAFARDGERLLAVHGEGASVLDAPALEKLQFDWLKERPSEEAPHYVGPWPDYPRPDRP